MILSYGEYEHVDNSVWFTVLKNTVRSARQIPIKQTVQFIIYGSVRGETTADVETAITGLETAYAVQGGDLIFKDNDGNNTPHTILNADTVNGVQPGAVRWLSGIQGYGSGTQLINRRDFQIVVSADIDFALSGDQNLESYSETVMLIGTGGTDFSIVSSFTGAPIRQDRITYTPYRAVQRGSAIGYLSVPTPPTPIWPTALKPMSVVNSIGTPKFYGAAQRHFPVSWSYEFESATALVGGPTYL